MRRRVMIGKRELVEVVEELKSSGTWMVPAGCKFVDVFHCWWRWLWCIVRP